MAKNLVIVESPAKAKTIKKFLGSSYQVIASNGHVRDLPKSQLGIDLEHDFEPRYITIRGKGELIAQLRKEVKKADKIFLATDPDREGEAISWHLYAALSLGDKKTQRITFNEITKEAVKGSLKQARNIDMPLVDAQQARRVLDRIVGYQISPVLWKKVKKGLSAGRVQSAALKLICDREDEITDFIPEEFWTIETDFTAAGKKGKLHARLASFAGEKMDSMSPEQAQQLEKKIQEQHSFRIREIKNGTRQRRSPLPFTTSTLQQEASKRINFTPQKTMRIAQQLYEGVDVPGHGTIGLITYLRTDSVRISEEARSAASEEIRKSFGEAYVGTYRAAAAKGRIQDAHEAIRPSYCTIHPEETEAALSRDQYRLYKLIWERFMASQMPAAEYETSQIITEAGGMEFVSAGSSLKFPGFMKVYKETDEDEKKLEGIIGLEPGMEVEAAVVDPEQHFTQPPARYTEASLVKEMEENGVGRPSTYAPTIALILSRGYVGKEKKALFVTELGSIVNKIISDYFANIVDIGFTARLESRLDEVEEGTAQWKQVIRDFYEAFEPEVTTAMEQLEKVELKDEVTDKICEKCGRNMVLKMGRFGKFYACPGFPECQNAKPYFETIPAHCPDCGGVIQVKKTKGGRLYYGCENYPECSYMSWDRPTDRKCPKCGAGLYEKYGRQHRYVCLNENCGFVEEIADTESEN